MEGKKNKGKALSGEHEVHQGEHDRTRYLLTLPAYVHRTSQILAIVFLCIIYKYVISSEALAT